MQRNTRIKMCGMTCEEDIIHAATLGVDAIGLIFYSKSPRFVSVERAKQLLRNFPPFLSSVAVLVNPTVDEVREIVSELPVGYLQFHGNETPQFCEQFHKDYIKAIPATSAQAIHAAINSFSNAAAILLDTPSVAHGGTGQAFDWTKIPSDSTKPLILAGGLDAGNICKAVIDVKPYAIDVCSGIEQSPGLKDHGKMIEFVNALRGCYE